MGGEEHGDEDKGYGHGYVEWRSIGSVSGKLNVDVLLARLLAQKFEKLRKPGSLPW